jgi:vancomycin resistance protein YoaR
LPQTEKAALMKRIETLGFSKEEAVRYVFFGIEDTVRDIESEINAAPVDSVVSFDPDGSPAFAYSEEREGFIVERTRLYDLLFARLCAGKSVTVAVPVSVLKPQYTRAYWRRNTVERASFGTGYAGSSPDRKHNVALALSYYNGLTVQPGQTVSFNGLVGERSEARGFRTAKSIMDGAYEDGVGGGVCQSSTTLYNAFLLAGLSVTRRCQHSLSSSYVSPGFDAMVSSGSADLAFRNDTGLPVYIKTSAGASGVSVKIYGAPKKYRIVRRHAVKSVEQPPPDKIVYDYEGKYTDKVFYSDECLAFQTSKTGMTVEAYLDYYDGGRFVKSEKLHTDRYRSLQGIYICGTRPRPAPPPEEFLPEF